MFGLWLFAGFIDVIRPTRSGHKFRKARRKANRRARKAQYGANLDFLNELAFGKPVNR